MKELEHQKSIKSQRLQGDEDDYHSDDQSSEELDVDPLPRTRTLIHIIVNVFLPKEKFTEPMLMNDEKDGPRTDVRMMSPIIKKNKKRFKVKKIMVSCSYP
mmetsp:Transcript_36085/g.55419  ORF Transcript_36085/g.55419 Transcript_36085/m.55419 type:complete len:101 (-) Transcript_36085:831-1133(-)